MQAISFLPSGTVKLSLPFGDRFIGKVSGDTYSKKVNPDLHKFNKNNSIGFNYELIDEGSFRFVQIEYGKQILNTTRLYILHFGKVSRFYKQGLDKQIFLSVDDFGLKRALDYERSLTTQLTLF